MYDKFSAEEVNLMCLFGTADRSALLAELRAGLGDIYDPDMRDVFLSTIAKLETLCDDQFADIGLYIADDCPSGGEA